MSSIEINKIAPDFAMDDFKGNSFRLSEQKGKNNVLIVLNRGFI